MPSLIFCDGVVIGLTTAGSTSCGSGIPRCVPPITANGDKEEAEGLGEGGSVLSLRLVLLTPGAREPT